MKKKYKKRTNGWRNWKWLTGGTQDVETAKDRREKRETEERSVCVEREKREVCVERAKRDIGEQREKREREEKRDRARERR